jgi:hypothetical protein
VPEAARPRKGSGLRIDLLSIAHSVIRETIKRADVQYSGTRFCHRKMVGIEEAAGSLGRLHWVRTVMSGLSFLAYLIRIAHDESENDRREIIHGDCS